MTKELHAPPERRLGSIFSLEGGNSPMGKCFAGAALILLCVLACCAQSFAVEIPLEKNGGVFTLPVRINGVLTLKFILDSGASEVAIPADVALTLVRTGTIRDSDFLPGTKYKLADGSELKGARLILRELEFGGIKINNVPCSVTPPAGDLLLGQSLLEKLDSWTLDNKRHVLIVGIGSQMPQSPRESLDPSKTLVLPPKAAVSTPPKVPTIQKMRSFIRACLGANERKDMDMDKVLSFYADKVDYFTKGIVSKSEIRKDKETYFKFWNDLSYVLDHDLTMSDANKPNTLSLKFTFTYHIHTATKLIIGTVQNQWDVENSDSEPKIVAEKQTVLSRDEFAFSSDMQNSLGQFSWINKKLLPDSKNGYNFQLLSVNQPIYHNDSYYSEPKTYFINNMPLKNCQSALTHLFSGGAHCCTTSILVTKCDQEEHVFSIELAHTEQDRIKFLDFDKSGARQISIYDWAFAYYDIDQEHSLSFASSPAFRRLLVFDGKKFRPDHPGEFVHFYDKLAQETENELVRVRGTSNSDFEKVALAITNTYYSLMIGRKDSESEKILYKDLPYSWQPVRSRVFADVKKAVLDFNPIKTIK